MRSWYAFARKEMQESVRSGKLVLFFLLFLLFGIMNPAMTKMTPWLMETLAGSLEESGMMITTMEVTAMSSWMQYYKNIPVAIILFLLLFGGSQAAEYQKGTLIPILTKGLDRWKVVLAKAAVMLLLWTAGYWMMFGITFGYTVYFWDNSVVSHSIFAGFCVYLTGIWLISLMMLFGTCLKSAMASLGGAGGVYLVSYVLGIFPAVQKYLPTSLFDMHSLLSVAKNPADFLPAIFVAIVFSVCHILGAIWIFDRKAL